MLSMIAALVLFLSHVRILSVLSFLAHFLGIGRQKTSLFRIEMTPAVKYAAILIVPID
jgi:hypothetical protein